MNKIKSKIPKTNLYNQLYIFHLDLRTCVFGQIDEDLQWSGVKMIALPIDRATIRPLFRVTTSLSNIGEIS